MWGWGWDNRNNFAFRHRTNYRGNPFQNERKQSNWTKPRSRSPFCGPQATFRAHMKRNKPVTSRADGRSRMMIWRGRLAIAVKSFPGTAQIWAPREQDKTAEKGRGFAISRSDPDRTVLLLLMRRSQLKNADGKAAGYRTVDACRKAKVRRGRWQESSRAGSAAAWWERLRNVAAEGAVCFVEAVAPGMTEVSAELMMAAQASVSLVGAGQPAACPCCSVMESWANCVYSLPDPLRSWKIQ
jgi:hypothetical protein